MLNKLKHNFKKGVQMENYCRKNSVKMWGIWRKTVLLQKECEWGRQTMHKWLVGCLYVWYTLHRNGFAVHKKLGCGFLAHS